MNTFSNITSYFLIFNIKLKQVNAPYQNALTDPDYKKNINRKSEEVPRLDQPYTFSTHWSTHHPSKYQQTTTTPLPTTQRSVYQFSKPTESYHHSSNIARRRSDAESYAEQPLSSNAFANNPLDGSAIDLGVSSSQDSRRSEHESHFENNLKASDVKSPSAHYSTPLLQPQYNSNYTQPNFVSTTQSFHSTSTSASTILPQKINNAFSPIFSSTTSRNSISTKGSQTDKLSYENGSTQSSNKKLNQKDLNTKYSSRGTTKFTNKDKPKSATIESRILSRPQNGIQSTTARNNLGTHQTTHFVSSSEAKVPLPPNDLLPPYESIHIYDDATTQGPPIYYEWKIPAIALEPPIYESQAITDYANNKISTTEQSTSDQFVNYNTVNQSNIKKPANGLEPPLFETASTQNEVRSKFAHNPFISAALESIATSTSERGSSDSPHKSPTPRSIPIDLNKDDDTVSNHIKTKDNNYLELKKLLHIPDYTFPLESDKDRKSYDKSDSVNSFQIKIPINHKEKERPWYGENAECPECHPSFVKPGTCEPCIKIR